jgi:protein-S-isoprenylcysteine O-methyltransferase Ste14
MSRKPWWQGARGEWYVVGQFVLLGLVLISRWWPGPLWAWPSALVIVGRIAGGLLALVGASFAFIGVWNLGRNLTAVPYPKEGSTMVIGGVYGIVRHPIYAGLIMGSIGWALFTHNLAALGWAIALFLLFDQKSRREEAWLLERFPDYAGYQRRVRKLIPFIY